MYNASTLKSSLISLIGWRQNIESNGVQLNALTTTTSGMYFNDEHPLLTIDNLLSIAPDFTRLYAAWDASTTYAEGTITRVGNVYYQSKSSHSNQQPPNATYWDVVSPFTDWLQEKTEAGIIRAIQAWADKKLHLRTGNNLLERNQLFQSTGRNTDLDDDFSRLVGFEFIPTRSRSILTNIEQVGIQLSQNQTITLYLFSSDNNTAIDSQEIVYTGAGSVQWETLNWQIDGNGAHYVVYHQNDLTGQSINGAVDYGANKWRVQTPCSKFYNAEAFSVQGGTTSALWDVASNSYTESTNYGLNFKVNVQCDYTTFIVEQKDLFKSVIAKQVAMDLLREMAYNPQSRVNRHESNVTREHILYEIDGQPQSPYNSLSYKFKQALDAIQFDTTGIDTVCLPCRKRGVRYKTA